jgi:hypothetical protein
MNTGSFGLECVIRSRSIAAVTLLLTFAVSLSHAAGTTPTFPWPVSVSAVNRRFLDQNGRVYLLKAMSSWAMAQNCTNAEITSALEALKPLGFNAVIVAPFGVHMNDSFGDRYRNKSGERFFTGAPYASSFGPAWSSMDWIMSEASRLQLTVVLSLFMSWGDTGTAPHLASAGTTNAYNFGKALAARYANYPNIVWHVMGDFQWSYNQGPALGLDAVFHGIKDIERTTHRLIIAEPANGSTSFDQFISQEGDHGYQWFKQSANTVYDYGHNSVEQFDKVFTQTGASAYPVVDIEPPYVNAPHYEDQQNQELRERIYSTFIRGGAGINFGHEKWWPFGVRGLYDGGPGWLNIITEPPLQCANYAWTFLGSYVQDARWTPDNGTFLKTGLGSGDDKAASGYSPSAGVVYFPTSRTIAVNTTAFTGGPNVRLRWYDPTNGTYTVISPSERKNSHRSVSYPSAHSDGFNDWILVVEGT